MASEEFDAALDELWETIAAPTAAQQHAYRGIRIAALTLVDAGAEPFDILTGSYIADALAKICDDFEWEMPEEMLYCVRQRFSEAGLIVVRPTAPKPDTMAGEKRELQTIDETTSYAAETAQNTRKALAASADTVQVPREVWERTVGAVEIAAAQFRSYEAWHLAACCPDMGKVGVNRLYAEGMEADLAVARSVQGGS